MTQLPASHEYQPTSYYKWGQGQPQEHCAGTSCDNLISMGAQQSQAAAASPAFHRLQQHQQPPAPSGIPKPRRSDPAPDSPPSGSPASSPGTSPRTSGGLDQFAPMLSSNPLQQLPLLPAAASIPSADMVRVAAWLLDQAGEQEGPAGAGASAANDLAANSPTEGQGWGQGRGGADCEGFRATGYFEEARRRSLDSVVRPHLAGQQHHCDALNNFVAALY